MTKLFSLGPILNISTGILITSMDDVYDLANFLTQDNLFTHQLVRAFKFCSPELKRQLPFLASPQLEPDMNELQTILGDKPNTGNRAFVDSLISGWLHRMEERYGKEHAVAPAPDAWLRRNPIEEAEALFGKSKVVVVVPNS